MPRPTTLLLAAWLAALAACDQAAPPPPPAPTTAPASPAQPPPEPEPEPPPRPVEPEPVARAGIQSPANPFGTINTLCPWDHKPINFPRPANGPDRGIMPMLQDPATDTLVGFCSRECFEKFRRDPRRNQLMDPAIAKFKQTRGFVEMGPLAKEPPMQPEW